MSDDNHSDDKEQNESDPTLEAIAETVGNLDALMDIDTEESLTVEVPLRTAAHFAFACWVGELNAGSLGEEKADKATEDIRREVIDQMVGLAEDDRDEVGKALGVLKAKMRSYAEFFKKENGGTLNGMLSSNDLPEEVREYLNSRADDAGIGTVDMADPEMPDEVREWFEDYIRERVGDDASIAEPESSEFTGSDDPAYF